MKSLRWSAGYPAKTARLQRALYLTLQAGVRRIKGLKT